MMDPLMPLLSEKTSVLFEISNYKQKENKLRQVIL